MHVNGPGLDNYNGKAEELETKLNERVVVGRAVGCWIKVGEGYLEQDEVGKVQADHFPLDSSETGYLCGNKITH